MARTSLEKTLRVLEFMRGLRIPEVATALARHGLTSAELDEVWASLRAANYVRFEPPPAPPLDAVAALEAWGARWMPIAAAALRRVAPGDFALVFDRPHELGHQRAATVVTFLFRLGQLPADGAGRARMAARGLDAAEIARGEALLAAFTTQVPSAAPQGLIVDPAAEDALWAWYLEWSAIARSAIGEPRLLRALGFRGRPGRPRRALEVEGTGEG